MVVFLKDLSMGLGNLLCQTVKFIKDPSKMISDMVQAFVNSTMERSTKVNGVMAIRKEQVFFLVHQVN